MRPQDIWWLIDYANKAAAYGTAVPDGGMDKFHMLTGPGIIQHDKQEDTDQDEIKGHPHVTEGGGTVHSDRAKGQIEFKGGVDLLTFFYASIMGNVASVGPTNFTHTIKAPGSGVDSPLSFSVIQATDRNVAATERKFNGVVPNSVELTIENPGPVMASVELLGDGSDVASAVTDPTITSAIKGNRLNYQQLTMKFGPASEDVTNIFRRLTIRANANIQQVPLPNKGTLIGEVHYGEQEPTLTAELVLKGQRGDTNYNYWLNRTKVIFDMLLQIDANNSLRIVGNSARVPAEAGDKDSIEGVENRLTIPVRFEYNTSDASPWIITGKNTIAAYLA